MIFVYLAIAILIAICSAGASTAFYSSYGVKVKEPILKIWKESKAMLLLLAVVYTIVAVGKVLIDFKKGEMFLQTVEQLILWNTFLIIAVIDSKRRRIPNRPLAFLLILRVLFMIGEIVYSPSEWRSVLFPSLIGFFLGGFIILLCMLLSRGGVGAGDMKMFAVCGAFFGLYVLHVMMYSLFLSAVFSIGLLIMRKAKLSQSIPMAPFILAGVSLYIAL